MRRMWDGGHSKPAIAGFFGASERTIDAVAKRDAWPAHEAELPRVALTSAVKAADAYRDAITRTGVAFMEDGAADLEKLQRDDTHAPSKFAAALTAEKGAKLVALGQGIGRPGAEQRAPATSSDVRVVLVLLPLLRAWRAAGVLPDEEYGKAVLAIESASAQEPVQAGA